MNGISLTKLDIESSQLKHCFYCQSVLPASNKEHIFNATWGGSHRTGGLICDACNSSFSASVDESFMIYTTTIMNASMFKGERHKKIPTIDNLEGDYFLEPGGKLRQKKPIITQEKQGDRELECNISFHTKGEAKRWIRNGDAEEWLGRPLTEEEQEILITKISQAEFSSEIPKPQKASTTLQLSDQYRSTAHTTLKCLGMFLPNWVTDEQTTKIRQFARYGRGNWMDFAVKPTQLLSLSSIFTEYLGVHHNSVEIYFCSHSKMIVGVLTILNRIKRAVVISENYTGSDKILYVVEDTYGSGKAPVAYLAELNSAVSPLLLIEIERFTASQETRDYFLIEINKLAGISYPIDSLVSQVKQKIETLYKPDKIVNREILEQYLQAFKNFFIDLARISNDLLDYEQLSTTILAYKLDDDTTQKLIGKSCNDKEFLLTMKKLNCKFMDDYQKSFIK